MKGRKRLKDKRKAADRGFEQLLGVHMNALEENSQAVVEILEILKDRALSVKDKSSLKKISKELKAVDRKVDNLGRAPKIQKEKEDDWFQF